MMSRALKTAVVEFLTVSQEEGQIPTCEVRVVPPDGQPVGCKGPISVTVWDMPIEHTSKIGFYSTVGCNVTISWRGKCTPTDRLDSLLDGKDGANDYKNWAAAVLHKARWWIAEYANTLVDASYGSGAYNGFTEAPFPSSESQWVPRRADWWGEAQPATMKPQTAWDTLAGYSCTIPFMGGKVLQTAQMATG